MVSRKKRRQTYVKGNKNDNNHKSKDHIYEQMNFDKYRIAENKILQNIKAFL